MTRFTRTMLIAGITLATTLASVANLQAGCGGGGGGYRRHYPTYSRPSYYKPAYRPQPQPVYQPAPQPQPGFQQPAIQQPAPQIQPAAPVAPQPAPVAQPQAPAAGDDAQMTALQALAGMTGQSQPQASVIPSQPQTPGVAGTWTARLGNGAIVQLTLQADGSFNWSATNKTGQVSSFQGSYTMAGGSLTLIRSEGNRKLAGTMTQTGGNAFNFKLAGANDNGLDFVRS